MPTVDMLGALFQNRAKPNNSIPAGRRGSTWLAKCDQDWMGTGYNASAGGGQVTRITFPAPATIAPGAKVYLKIKNGDCTEQTLEIHNCDTTAQPIIPIVLAKFNGTPTPGALITITPAETVGFSAVALSTPANTIEITGKPGSKYQIIPSEFGLTTQAGVANPAMPTVVTTVSAIKAGKIPYGSALVSRPATAALAFPSRENSFISNSSSQILYLPTGAPDEIFVGWSIRDINAKIAFSADTCCDDRNCDEGWDCKSCMHYVNNCCHNQQIILQLEPLTASSSVPPSGGWEGAPLYYRKSANGANTQLGEPSIFPATGDTSVSNAKTSTGVEWVVKQVLDRKNNLVVAGQKGV